MPILGRALLLACALALLGGLAAGDKLSARLSARLPDLSFASSAAQQLLELLGGGSLPSLCLALRPRGRLLPLCVAFEQVAHWPSGALPKTLRGSLALFHDVGLRSLRCGHQGHQGQAAQLCGDFLVRRERCQQPELHVAAITKPIGWPGSLVHRFCGAH